MNLTNIKKKRIAIIGLGYIGANLFAYLKSLNIEPICIDRQNLPLIEKEEFDHIINCAGNSGNFRQELIKTIESNIELNIYILKHARIKNSYIYLSSTRIYGFSEDKHRVFNENSYSCYSNLSLDYIYDGSKKVAESLLCNYSNQVNYKIGILRLSNVYGNFNNLDDSTLIKKIVRYKREDIKDSLFVNQSKDSKKDYIHIEDVIKNITYIALNIDKTDVYNLAYGQSYSLNDIENIVNIKIDGNDSIRPTFSNISINKISQKFQISNKYSFENWLKSIS